MLAVPCFQIIAIVKVYGEIVEYNYRITTTTGFFYALYNFLNERSEQFVISFSFLLSPEMASLGKSAFSRRKN